MAVTPGNAAMGPGTIYIGDFGATEPTADAAGIASTPGAAWTDCGGTMGGITVSIGQKYKNLEFDQVSMPVGARKTEESITVKAKLGEVTLTNIDLLMEGGTLTDGAGYDKWEPAASLTGTDEPTYKALIIDGPGPAGERRRIIVRKCLNTDSVDLGYEKDGQQVFQATFEGYYVSSSIRAYELLQATAGS